MADKPLDYLDRLLLDDVPQPRPRAPKSNRSADDLARDYTDDAIETFAEVMRDPLAEHRDRIRAAENLIDRAYGKAVTPVAVQHSGKLSHQLAEMTDDQLYAVLRREPLPRLAAPVVDAVVVDRDPLLD